MTVKIELTFANLDEATAFLAGKTKAAADTGTTKPDPKPDPKPGKSSTAGAAAEPSSAKTEAAASTPKTEATKPADVPTYEKSGIPEKIKAAVDKDKTKVIALLGEFGVKKGGELKPEQFADFTTKIDALLAGGDDLS